MRIKQLLQPCVMLCLAGTMTAVTAQGLLPTCTSLPPAERESARLIGACREAAPIVDVVPRGLPTAAPSATPGAIPVVALVPNVVGLSFDDARGRLAGFTVQRSYRPSAEPGGTVLEQQPAPPARVAAGATVRVVLSDATLRPAPRVPAGEIDAVRRPETAALPAAPPVQPAAQQPSAAPSAPGNVAVTQNNTEARTLPAPTVPRSSAEARKLIAPTAAPQVAVSPRSSVAPAKAPVSRARVEPVPAPSAPAATSAPVIETLELPNVIGRSSADATAAFAEFKIERVEIVANAAPSGQVLAQDPKPGTPMAAGSAIGLQVSDGSLASASVTAPAVVPTPAPAPAQKAATPVQNRAPVTFPSTAVLLLIAGVLAGLGFGAWLMRRWLAQRHDARTEAEASAPLELPAEIDRDATSAGAVIETAPSAASALPIAAVSPAAAPLIIFAARLGEGETTIEFPAPSDAEEMALEYSKDLHE